MRVNELSKQIGKSNKEVLEILQKNHFDVKSHSSKVTEEQAEAVRCFLAGAKRQTTASKTDTGKAETNRVEDIKKEQLVTVLKAAWCKPPVVQNERMEQLRSKAQLNLERTFALLRGE